MGFSVCDCCLYVHEGVCVCVVCVLVCIVV